MWWRGVILLASSAVQGTAAAQLDVSPDPLPALAAVSQYPRWQFPTPCRPAVMAKGTLTPQQQKKCTHTFRRLR